MFDDTVQSATTSIEESEASLFLEKKMSEVGSIPLFVSRRRGGGEVGTTITVGVYAVSFAGKHVAADGCIAGQGNGPINIFGAVSHFPCHSSKVGFCKVKAVSWSKDGAFH
jgi:hypothetical protein